MKRIFFLLFVILATGSVAQIPGYMGKRFSIGYSNYFSPRLPILTAVISELSTSNDYDIAASRSFNYTHCIDADYILGSRVSLCLSGQFAKMDLCKYGSNFTLRNTSGTGPSDYIIFYSPAQGKNMELRTTNFSIGFKFFKERYLNPFGRYRKIEFVLVTNKVLMDKDEFYYASSSSYTPYKYTVSDDASYKYKSFVFAFTMGKQRVLCNKLVLDYGLRVGLNYNYILKSGNVIGSIVEISKDNDEQTLDMRLKEVANIRVFQSQILNVHLGLRFLAF